VNSSGLKANLEAQILTSFLWILVQIPLETSWKSSWWWCGPCLKVMWPSIVDDLGHHWMRKTLHLVNDVMVELCGEVLVCHGKGWSWAFDPTEDCNQ